jgi:GTP-binding protein
VAKIKIKSGDGGDGKISFHREKYIASGGPDGGDGGKGGDVFFASRDDISTLADFRYKKNYVAQDGEPGKPANCSGKSAQALTIYVPNGTVLRDLKTGNIIADICSKEPQLIAKGGVGGWGNTHFANAVRQAPRFAKPGMPGQEFELQLELKLLADVAVIGFPNVGKSTFLSVISNAKPAIANYHFTTLSPVLGVVKIREGSSFVVADIPGLIEGAWHGAGLGHEFLRHIERCRLFLHMIDISATEGRNPKEDFEIICKELYKFNPELKTRPMIVVANKCDIINQDEIKEFEKHIKQKGYEFFPISAAAKNGINPLINKIEQLLKTLPPIHQYTPQIEKTQFSPQNHDVTITKHGSTYFVEGEWLERALRTIDLQDNESLGYFQKLITNFGVINSLKSQGMQNGDTVDIYGNEFDFFD